MGEYVATAAAAEEEDVVTEESIVLNTTTTTASSGSNDTTSNRLREMIYQQADQEADNILNNSKKNCNFNYESSATAAILTSETIESVQSVILDLFQNQSQSQSKTALTNNSTKKRKRQHLYHND